MPYCNHTKTIGRTSDGGFIDSPSAVVAYRECSDCGVNLPDTWECKNCEFVELSRLAEPRGLRFTKGQPCVRHTDWRPTPTAEAMNYDMPAQELDALAASLNGNPSIRRVV